MKKLLYIFLFFTCFANAQIVTIPDQNFKTLLLEANDINYTAGGLIIDTNSDGEIQLSEAQAITSLSITGTNIEDITGITSFSNLLNLSFANTLITTINIPNFQDITTLTFNNNSILNSINASDAINLTTVNFQNNPQLNSINFSNCVSLNGFFSPNSNLTSLNLSGCTSIGVINLDLNDFTTIDLSGLINLQYLYLNGNQLSSINLSGCNNLLVIECMNNQLATLNFHDLPVLASIRANGNLISSFEMYSLPNLSWIDVTNNPLQNVDASNLPSLIYLEFGSPSPIEWINIKNGVNTDISLSNPNSIIHNICVDESEISNLNTAPFTFTNPPTTYCSFTPGGNYNTITGTITFDLNSDGCDVNDQPKQNVRIDINDSTNQNQGATFTNSEGIYNFYTNTGSFTITPNIENPTWFTFSPIDATISFDNNNNNVTTQNFCLSANGNHTDLEVVIAPITPAQPGFTATYQLLIKNKGNFMSSGQFALTYNDELLDFLDAGIFPNAQIEDSLIWNFTDLQPFETLQTSLSFSVNSPTDVPPVNIGDELIFNATVNPTEVDEIPVDNIFNFNQTVVGSYDPNDITCIEGDVVPTSEIGEYLHYVINFENTGNSEAQNIVVRTEIDAEKFDVNSLQMLNTSHNAYIRQNGSVVEFIFQNIALESGGHGNVLLKIKTKSNLQNGDSVTKQATIYFDYNAPIETNLANTTFQTLGSGNFEMDASISVHPNPTSSIVNINCDSTIKSIQLYDVQGRLLQTQIVNNGTTSIDISDQSSGIYFAKIMSEVGVKIEKIIKE